MPKPIRKYSLSFLHLCVTPFPSLQDLKTPVRDTCHCELQRAQGTTERRKMPGLTSKYLRSSEKRTQLLQTAHDDVRSLSSNGSLHEDSSRMTRSVDRPCHSSRMTRSVERRFQHMKAGLPQRGSWRKALQFMDSQKSNAACPSAGHSTHHPL